MLVTYLIKIERPWRLSQITSIQRAAGMATRLRRYVPPLYLESTMDVELVRIACALARSNSEYSEPDRKTKRTVKILIRWMTHNYFSPSCNSMQFKALLPSVYDSHVIEAGELLLRYWDNLILSSRMKAFITYDPTSTMITSSETAQTAEAETIINVTRTMKSTGTQTTSPEPSSRDNSSEQSSKKSQPTTMVDIEAPTVRPISA